MKKIYLLCCAIFWVGMGHAQVLDIPDTNFKSYLLLATPENEIAKDLEGNYFKIDANNDAKVELNEALQVSFLNLSSMDIDQIYSLSGILNFTNLKTLECHHNHLSALDLHGLTSLEAIYCNNNVLEQLDVTGCTSLTNLVCSRNMIEELYLNDCVNLNAVQCDRNNLTTLDVSDCHNLDLLFCQYNQLTSLYKRNGHYESQFHFQANPDLHYVCADDSETNEIAEQMTEWGQSCDVDTSCLLKTNGFETSSPIVLYPNPTNNILNISTQLHLNGIAIYNALGQSVLQIANANQTSAIDVSNLSKGTYFVKLTSDSAETTLRFIRN